MDEADAAGDSLGLAPAATAMIWLGPVGPVDPETGRSPVDPLEGIPSYVEVAQTLAPDIRAAIEERMPCLGGGEHDWDTEVIEISTWGERSTRNLRNRRCRRCHLSTPNPSYDGGIKHGTSGGFRAHTAKGEIPCKPCLDAEKRWAERQVRESEHAMERLALGFRSLDCECLDCGKVATEFHAHIKTADGTVIA